MLSWTLVTVTCWICLPQVRDQGSSYEQSASHARFLHPKLLVFMRDYSLRNRKILWCSPPLRCALHLPFNRLLLFYVITFFCTSTLAQMIFCISYTNRMSSLIEIRHINCGSRGEISSSYIAELRNKERTRLLEKQTQASDYGFQRGTSTIDVFEMSTQALNIDSSIS